jgi:hypothetical protein
VSRRRAPLPPFAQLRSRAGFFGGVAAIGVAASVLGAGAGAFEPSPRDAAELARALGAATGAVVHPEDIRWEPSRGVLSDLVCGRFALYLASPTDSSPRDVYRARVRLSPEGRPLSVGDPRNLTSTPLGDDHALVVRGTRAAFATFTYGKEQAVTLLDLSGEGAQNGAIRLADRVMAWITNVQQTGAGDGIGRLDVTFAQPADRLGLALGARTLDIALADDARPSGAPGGGAARRSGGAPGPTRTARVDLATGELLGEPPGMHADPARHLPKKLTLWAVDTVRAVSWIGPAPIAWLEERTFAIADTARKTMFKIGGGGEALATEAGAAPPPPTVLDASQASADLGHWPPPPVRSIWKTPEPGEGEWVLPKQTWIKKLPGDAPSPFYTTFVRPDEERPYAKVLLVAMDMRQLDLDMEAGTEDPKPLTGPPGTGRIPRDPAIYTRIAAAFNGGFKTEHGAYGMMLHRRVLLPPMPGAATVIMTKDHRVGMGTWGVNKDVGGIVGIDARDILSFRQNLDPLVENDKVNPLGRAQWGFTLPGTGMQTERTGICVTSAGHLLYAWGDDLNANTLGRAMKMAGCIYGMHLDMNPYHTGFLFTNITELKKQGYRSELLTSKMQISPDRYISYAPKDFFFLTLHDPTPPALASASATGSAAADPKSPPWEPDPGVQPAPPWMPGLWRTTLAARAGAGSVDVFEVEPARATFRVRAGTTEPEPAGPEAARARLEPEHELSQDDAHRVVFALTLGASEARHHRGLVTDGRVALPPSGAEHMAMLVASEDGELSIAPTRAALPPRADAAELPLLLEDGKALSPPVTSASSARARTRGVSALGVTPGGRVVVARARDGATAADVASALKRASCTQAVVLDRGAAAGGRIDRAGTSSPPRSRYEQTVLYAMGKALVPRGFRFEAARPYEPPSKKK